MDERVLRLLSLLSWTSFCKVPVVHFYVKLVWYVFYPSTPSRNSISRGRSKLVAPQEADRQRRKTNGRGAVSFMHAHYLHSSTLPLTHRTSHPHPSTKPLLSLYHHHYCLSHVSLRNGFLAAQAPVSAFYSCGTTSRRKNCRQCWCILGNGCDHQKSQHECDDCLSLVIEGTLRLLEIREWESLRFRLDRLLFLISYRRRCPWI